MFILHLLLILYSFVSVCSKLAAQQPMGSLYFFLIYGVSILLLGIYAVVWQQIIKYLPLTTAFANKAITVCWGIVWGVLLFHESVTLGKITGALLIVFGVVLFAFSDFDKEDSNA